MFGRSRVIWVMLLWVLAFGFALTPLSAQVDTALIAEEGPYHFGVRIFELVDESRDDRTLQTIVWYPALDSEERPFPTDTSGAPYPLVIYSHGYTGAPAEATHVFIEHLVSHGFVVAAVNHQDTRDTARALVDRPLDVLFLLDQLAALEDSPLAGIIDTDNVGVAGYSFGGYTTLTVGGARIDQQYFMDWCTTQTDDFPNHCGLVSDWDELNAYRDQFVTSSDDDLWPAMTDERIRAIYPIAACFGQLFGERGFESVRVPAFIVAGTGDTSCPYETDSAYMFEHIASPERYLLSMLKRGHGPIMYGQWNEPAATAFFGYYLQGKEEYAEYLTPELAESFNDAMMEVSTGE